MGMYKIVVKAITWRIIATTVTILIAYAVTGHWAWAGIIGLLDAVVKFVLYIAHEYAWERKE